MQIVARPSNPPHRCAVNPSVTEDPDGFVDTGTVLNAVAPAIYVSACQVRELAALFDYLPPEKRTELEGRIGELEEELAQAQDELKQADYQLNAIEVLKNSGYEAKKRAGRPPKGAKAA